MTQKLRFGAKSTLNRNTASYSTPTWLPILPVGDVNLNISFEKANASTRGQQPIAANEPTQLILSIDFTMLEDIADVNYLAIRAAALAKTSLDILACTDVAGTAGEASVRCDYKVQEFKKGEPLNGINTYNVVIEPCYSANPAVFGP
jgi:hypothetical protein